MHPGRWVRGAFLLAYERQPVKQSDRLDAAPIERGRSLRRIRYRRRPTIELAAIGFVFLAGLLAATLVIAGREDRPPSADSDVPGAWTRQPSGTGVTLLDVAFVGPNEGWVVGQVGTILHTSNGGDTWEPQVSGTKVRLQRLSFPDAEHGWAVGTFGTILHTSNGGDTWERQVADETLDLNLAGVSFLDQRVGWVVTEQGNTLLSTVDGGRSWSLARLNSNAVRAGLSFIDSQRGWVASTQGGVWHTADGGTTWESQGGIDGRINGLFFLDERNGWISGWRRKDSGLRFVKFLTDGAVGRTDDGGISWTRHETGTGQLLWDVAFVSPEEGWSVGASGTIVYSSDGGVEWEQQASGVTATLRAVAFAGTGAGWAVGESGVILKFSR